MIWRGRGGGLSLKTDMRKDFIAWKLKVAQLCHNPCTSSAVARASETVKLLIVLYALTTPKEELRWKCCSYVRRSDSPFNLIQESVYIYGTTISFFSKKKKKRNRGSAQH